MCMQCNHTINLWCLHTNHWGRDIAGRFTSSFCPTSEVNSSHPEWGSQQAQRAQPLSLWKYGLFYFLAEVGWLVGWLEGLKGWTIVMVKSGHQSCDRRAHSFCRWVDALAYSPQAHVYVDEEFPRESSPSILCFWVFMLKVYPHVF